MMWWVYILVFLGGAIVGVMLMALMAALPKDSERHEVHVYCDENGNLEIVTFPMEDKVIWHKKPEDIEKRIEQYEGTLEMVNDMNLHA